MIKKRLEAFVTSSGRCPFDEWLEGLSDQKQGIVIVYLRRVTTGGSRRNIKSLKQGLFELKINIDGGLRVYFAEVRGTLILLLTGGDKSSQRRDIATRHYPGEKPMERIWQIAI